LIGLAGCAYVISKNDFAFKGDASHPGDIRVVLAEEPPHLATKQIFGSACHFRFRTSTVHTKFQRTAIYTHNDY